MSRAHDELPREILRLLADAASRGDEKGLTRPQIAQSLGYSESVVSQCLRLLLGQEKVTFERAHTPGAGYRVLHYRTTTKGLTEGSQDPPLAPFTMPEPAQPFVGRAHELARLRRAYRSGGVVVVEGMSGMGKTALVRRSLRHAWSRLRPVWTTLSPALESEDILPALRPEGAGAHAKESRSPRPRGGGGASPGLWVVDDLDRATPSALEVVQGATSSLDASHLHSAVLITSKGLSFPIRRGPALHLTLSGLPRRDALLLARAVGLAEDRFEEAYRGTLGSPRYLRQSTLPTSEDGAGYSDVVISSLAPEMRSALLPFALAWHGVPVSLALKMGFDEGTLERLRSLSILEGPATGLRVVEPVAHRLVEATPWEDLREAHASLAYLTTSVEPPERFCHLVLAERSQEALGLLREDEALITRRAHAQVLQAGLKLATLLPPGPDRGSLWLALSEMQRASGDPFASARYLSSALENLDRDDPRAVLASARLVHAALRLGSLHQVDTWSSWLRHASSSGAWRSVRLFAQGAQEFGKGNWKAAALRFARSEELAVVENQPELQLLAALQLMEVQRRMDKVVQAEGTFRRVLPLALKSGTPDIVRRIRLTGALLLTKNGDLEKARETYAELGEEARESGAKAVEAIAWLGLAYLAKLQGDLKSAISGTKKAIVISESISDWMTASRGYAGLSNLMRLTGNLKEARVLLARAKSLSQEFGPALSLPWTLEAESLLEGDEKRIVREAQTTPGRIRVGPDGTPLATS